MNLGLVHFTGPSGSFSKNVAPTLGNSDGALVSKQRSTRSPHEGGIKEDGDSDVNIDFRTISRGTHIQLYPKYEVWGHERDNGVFKKETAVVCLGMTRGANE